MPGSTASSQDTQQPIAQLDWLSSWKLNYVSLLQVSATKNDLNNVQAWDRGPIVRFSSADESAERRDSSKAIGMTGVSHQDCRKAVQTGSKRLD